MAKRYYGAELDYEGEVDHGALLVELGRFDGWALSTSARALPAVLQLCPAGVRVGAWVKPGGIPKATRGPHNRWEPLIVYPARYLRPPVRDWLEAHPARRGGTLPGRKPLRFVLWMFEMMGALPGDELADLFPGTGIVGRAWAELSRAADRDASVAARAATHSPATSDGCVANAGVSDG